MKVFFPLRPSPLRQNNYLCNPKKNTTLNYLAHITLSGTNKQMQLGGFIADFVKGNKKAHYPANVWRGIVLHRKIDEFTDNHPAVREAINLLRPSFGRYSAIVLDMYFDHILAKNFSKYTEHKSLWLFSMRFSINALRSYAILPERVKGFIFHFIFTNRLYKYRKTNGLYESLKIMSIYKVQTLEPEQCIAFLELHEAKIKALFEDLYKDLEVFVAKEIMLSKA